MTEQNLKSVIKLNKGIYVMVGSDFVEDYLSSIKLLPIIPIGLVEENRVWMYIARGIHNKSNIAWKNFAFKEF